MPTLSFLRRAAGGLFAVCVFVSGCGGDVVVDAPDDGGASGSGASSTSSSSGGGRTCMGHSDCEPTEVCVFATGACSPVCGAGSCDSTCGAGSICDGCATSSCPECADCLAACQPRQDARCDDDDPCPAGQACDFAAETCRASCPGGVECNNSSEFCSVCVTGSCCGCEDCVNLCMPGF